MSDLKLKALSDKDLASIQNELFGMRELLRPAFDAARKDLASRELITKDGNLSRDNTALDRFVPVGAVYTNVISAILEIEQIRAERTIAEPGTEPQP